MPVQLLRGGTRYKGRAGTNEALTFQASQPAASFFPLQATLSFPSSISALVVTKLLFQPQRKPPLPCQPLGHPRSTREKTPKLRNLLAATVSLPSRHDDALLQPRGLLSSKAQKWPLLTRRQVFLLLVFEMGLFMLLLVPLPFTIKRKIFTCVRPSGQAEPACLAHAYAASSPRILSLPRFSIG